VVVYQDILGTANSVHDIAKEAWLPALPSSVCFEEKALRQWKRSAGGFPLNCGV